MQNPEWKEERIGKPGQRLLAATEYWELGRDENFSFLKRVQCIYPFSIYKMLLTWKDRDTPNTLLTMICGQAFRYMTWQPPLLGTYWAALWCFALTTLTSTQYKQKTLLTCRKRDTLQTCYWLWCTVRLYAIWPLPTRVLAPSDTWRRAEQLCGFELW